MVRATKLEIAEQGDGPWVKLRVAGELDLRTIAPLSERVSERLLAGARDLTLDLSALEFMDSSGLRLLIELHDRSRAEGWRLRLTCPEHEAAALVIRTTGADAVLPFAKAGEP